MHFIKKYEKRSEFVSEVHLCSFTTCKIKEDKVKLREWTIMVMWSCRWLYLFIIVAMPRSGSCFSKSQPTKPRRSNWPKNSLIHYYYSVISNEKKNHRGFAAFYAKPISSFGLQLYSFTIVYYYVLLQTQISVNLVFVSRWLSVYMEQKS